MKCKDCVYFGRYLLPLCAINYCYLHETAADPYDEGACDDGEPKEIEVEK